MPSIECSMNSLSSFSIKRTLLSIWLFILTLMLSNRLHPVSPVSALLPYSLYFLTAWLVFPRSCIWPCRKACTHPRDATTDGKWPVPVFLSLSPFRSSSPQCPHSIPPGSEKEERVANLPKVGHHIVEWAEKRCSGTSRPLDEYTSAPISAPQRKCYLLARGRGGVKERRRGADSSDVKIWLCCENCRHTLAQTLNVFSLLPFYPQSPSSHPPHWHKLILRWTTFRLSCMPVWQPIITPVLNKKPSTHTMLAHKSNPFPLNAHMLTPLHICTLYSVTCVCVVCLGNTIHAHLHTREQKGCSWGKGRKEEVEAGWGWWQGMQDKTSANLSLALTFQEETAHLDASEEQTERTQANLSSCKPAQNIALPPSLLLSLALFHSLSLSLSLPSLPLGLQAGNDEIVL